MSSRVWAQFVVIAKPIVKTPAVPSTLSDARSIAQSLGATGVRQLDAVVIIGSPVMPSPEREQPTAIGIVRPPQLAPGTYMNIGDVIRTHLPGVILWERGPVGAAAPVAALRGISSFTTRAVKTYVDGIELASPELFTLVDVHSIDRIELIRGPQGAALYGPDALNGILRIETRHGHPGENGIRARGTASAGSLRRSEITNPDLVQDYTIGVTGARGLMAFDVGGAFAQTGIGGAFPRMKSWSVNGGARSLFGRFTLDASARAGRREYSVDSVVPSGEVIAGAREPRALEDGAVAVSVVHTPGERWKQTLIAGYQRSAGVREPFHSPLLAPTLPLGATDETASRASLRYSASVEASQAFTLSGGVEHSLRTLERVARGPMNLYQRFRNLRSTGAFVQGRARAGHRLVFSGGARAERVSSVDPGVGLLWASTAGASWSHEFRSATVRVRGAWGNGIRPPEPGMNQAFDRELLHQQANDNLIPERQRGVETGADVFLTGGGYLKVTVYDQRATDLIQPVLRRRVDAAGTFYEFQNVGAVRNRGSEFEAGLQRRGFNTAVTAYFPRSSVTRLGPGYSGELQLGDKMLEVPDAAGSGMIAYDFGRVRAEIGMSWIGSWIGYDRVLIANIEQQQRTPRETPREYWRTYDDVVRPYASVTARVGAHHAFLRVDNFGNSKDAVRDNLSPTLGRTIVLGIARQE